MGFGCPLDTKHRRDKDNTIVAPNDNQDLFVIHANRSAITGRRCTQAHPCVCGASVLTGMPLHMASIKLIA
jgi:hypothetical protein